MAEPVLMTIELRFRTEEEPDPLAERIKESVRMIVGADRLEDFRWRGHPLEGPKDRI